MLKRRDNFLLVFAAFVILCSFAASVTFIATAQEANQSQIRPGASENAAAPSPETVAANNAPADVSAVADADESAKPTDRQPGRYVSVAGRALDANDKGRPNAAITLYEADGTSHQTTSDRSGNFRFEKIADGQTIALSSQNEQDDELDVSIRLAGETRVFWRTPDIRSQTKNGKH